MEGFGNRNLSPRTKKYALRGLGGLAAAGTLASTIYFAPEIWRGIENLGTRPSEAVAGVPSLVVGYDSRDVWTGKFYQWRYWLDIEQCPQDVAAANNGDSDSESFSHETDQLTPGCYADWVRVSGDDFSHFGIGSTIIFKGKPTDHLRK